MFNYFKKNKRDIKLNLFCDKDEMHICLICGVWADESGKRYLYWAPKPCENLGIIAAENQEMVQICFYKVLKLNYFHDLWFF